jgi:hypothetical protein
MREAGVQPSRDTGIDCVNESFDGLGQLNFLFPHIF